MPHYHVTEFGHPEPAQRAEVLAAARGRIREIPTDRDGNVHVSDVLEALDDEAT